MFEVTEGEIINVATKLSNKKSCGKGDIQMMKKSIHILDKPLAYIINYSSKYEIFPKSLKIAVVRPIHKKNDPSDID